MRDGLWNEVGLDDGIKRPWTVERGSRGRGSSQLPKNITFSAPECQFYAICKEDHKRAIIYEFKKYR